MRSDNTDDFICSVCWKYEARDMIITQGIISKLTAVHFILSVATMSLPIASVILLVALNILRPTGIHILGRSARSCTRENMDEIFIEQFIQKNRPTHDAERVLYHILMVLPIWSIQ